MKCLECDVSPIAYTVDPKTNRTVKDGGGYCRECYERLVYLATKKYMADKCDIEDDDAVFIY